MMMKSIKIYTPLNEKTISGLRAGDRVAINGYIYTARDAAHQRFCEQLRLRRKLPLDLTGAVLYFAGPTPARPGRPIGSVGPTTSYRLDAYSPLLLAKTGLKGMIGKGNRSAVVIDAMKKYHGVYFAAVGGAGALLAESVVAATLICYEDLGPEAVRRLEVKDFPAIVAIDCRGRNLYEEGPPQFQTFGPRGK